MSNAVMFGVVLALASAACFAAQMTLTASSLRAVSASAVLWITTALNFIAVSAWAVATGGGRLTSAAWLTLLLAGIFAPLLGRIFQVRGLAALGSNISTPILMTHPAVTIALSITWLGETPSATTVAGGVLVIAGSMVVASQGLVRAGAHRTFSLGAASLPALGALTYGVSMIFRKIAMMGGADPATAAAATIAPSWVAYTGYWALLRRPEAFRCRRKDLPLLIWSSAFASIAAVLWFSSIKFAPLAVIAPLAATAPLFALIFTYLFFRSAERFSGAVLLGTAVSVLGVVLTTVGAT